MDVSGSESPNPDGRQQPGQQAPPPPSQERSERPKSGKRRRIIVIGAASAAVVVGAGVLGGLLVGGGSGKPQDDAKAGGSPTGSAQRGQALSPKDGKVRMLLPRLRNVSGISAFTAECRDVTYATRGRAVTVTVVYQGPGVVNVGVYPVPGDGRNQLTQIYSMSRKQSRHVFAFRHVPGSVHHVRVTVTAKAGVDQCYARRK